MASGPDARAEFPDDLRKGLSGHAHHEGECVAPDVATETVERPALRIDVERGGLLFVERTETEEALTPSGQNDMLRDNVNDVYGLADPLDRLFWYTRHIRKGEEVK